MLNVTTDPAVPATLLAASIATGDLGASCNCLSMGLGLSNSAASSGSGTSLGSELGAAKTTDRKRASTRLSRSAYSAAPFRTAIGTEEVDPGVNLDSAEGANVIDLGSTLRLPRTPSLSPSRSMGGNISFPYIQSQFPRGQAPEPQTQNPNSSQPQRTPRKSFLAKLKKQLSSKGSHPSPSIPSSSPSQSSPRSKSRFTFHLSLPQPLTPLSLSAPTSSLSSPVPSPNQSHANLHPATGGGGAKRESASANGPVPLSVANGALLASLSRSNFESPPHGDVARRKEGRDGKTHEAEDEDTKSVLSLGDCLESGWEGVSKSRSISGLREAKQETKTERGVKCEEVDVRRLRQEMQPFPGVEDGVLERREPEERERAREQQATEKLLVDDGDDVNFSNTTKTTVNAKGDAKLDLESNPNETTCTYAPFVPLVFQHERLQQKLKVPLPIVEFQGGMKECEIESVPISPHVPAPFPPRQSSFSASSIRSIRKRTKSAPSSSVPFLNFKVPPFPVPAFPVLLSSSQGQGSQRKRPSTATSPSTQIYMQGTSTSNNKARKKPLDNQNDNKLKRPDTAPASTTANIPSIPFPVLEEGLDASTKQETERQRTASKLSVIKKKAVPERLQPPSLRSSSSTLVLPITGSGDENNEGESVGDGDGCRLSWHPYARTSGRASPELKTQPASRAERSLPPTSPTAFNSSGSEASTRSPITPMSPLFWANAGTVSERKGAALSGAGIGLSVKIPEGGQIESQNETKASGLELDIEGSGGSRNNDYDLHHVPHFYRRSYTRTNVHFGISVRDKIVPFIQRRPSRPAVPENGTTGIPPPPAPAGLPSIEKEVECGRSGDKEELRNHTQLLTFASGTEGDYLDSPLPEEYFQTFSNSSAQEDDDPHTISHPYQMHSPSNSHSRSSGSYEHDSEYEALLAANTLANAGVLGSIRNIGVGRQLMSAHVEPQDPSSLKIERNRKCDNQCDAGVGSEWTLYLGNDDDIPPVTQDLLADISHEPFGLASGSMGKSLEGVRGRTKSESALRTLEFGKTPGIQRLRSSTMTGLAGFTSPPPPVPELPKERQIQSSDDWTLSLPILPPDKGVPVNPNSEEKNLKGSNDLSDPVSTAASSATLIAGGGNTLRRSISKRHTYSQPEVIVCVEGVAVEDDDQIGTYSDGAGQATVAGTQRGTSFGLDLDSLELDDDEDEDSLLDFSAETTVTGGPGLLPLEHIQFSVPRLVSKGSGIESATWGSEIIDDTVKKRRRRFSDGLESLMAMAGVSVRMGVDSDGASVCVVDGQSLHTTNGEEGDGDERTTEEGETLEATNTKENFARLDALSADLKRFNELLKEGIDATKRSPVLSPVAVCSPDTLKKAMDLKQARSCGILSSQTEVQQVPVDPFRVQQIIDGLRISSPDPVSAMPVSSADIKKTLLEYPLSSSGPSNTISPSVPTSSIGPSSNTPATRIRPPLPFAPLSHSSLSVGPSTYVAHLLNAHGRPTTGRTMSMSIPALTKPSLPSTTVSNISSAIPVGVVGSGLKVGGNGRVISLSGSASSPPPLLIGTASRNVTGANANTEKRAAIVVTPDDDGEGENIGLQSNADMDPKRNSVSSSTSAESFFTSFSTCSQASTPPPNNCRLPFSSSDRGSNSDPSTPKGTLGYGLTIIATSATSIANGAGMSPNPLTDVYTPSSSAMPTPLASSFPAPPPLPASYACLGDSLNIVNRILAAATMDQDLMTSHEYCSPMTTASSSSSRLSCASNVSVATIVPSSEQIIHGLEKLVSYDASGRLKSEMDTESFYSARSSFDTQ